MDRCRLLVEGQTEETFANRTLLPHLYTVGFHAVSVTVLSTRRIASGGKHRGGLTTWRQLRNDVNLLVRDGGAVVTTMVDLYALPADVPGVTTGAMGTSARERVAYVEREIGDAIGTANFVPHVMLHEFEALLYADPAAVARHFDDDSISAAIAADLRAVWRA